MIGVYFCVLTLSCSVPAEGKPLQAVDHGNGHANLTFLLNKQDSDHLVKKKSRRATAICLCCFLYINHQTLLVPQKSSPSPSPSCPSRSRHAIVRPAVKPPPVPAYAAKQKEPQPQSAASPQKQYSPQAYTPPPFKSELRRNQAPLPPSGPPPLPSPDTKTHSQHSAADKSRPDPPNRPPPPCPVKKPSVVNIFSIFLGKNSDFAFVN